MEAVLQNLKSLFRASNLIAAGIYSTKAAFSPRRYTGEKGCTAESMKVQPSLWWPC